MSQLGSITAEKEKQMALERQRFQEAKAKMLAQQKYKRAARTAGHIALNIVVALIVLLPLLYAVSIAFMPSGELFTLDMNILPKHPTLENFRQALQKVPLVRFVVNSFLVAGLITFGQIISCSLAAFSFSFLDFKGKNVLFMLVMATMMIPGEATIISNYLTVSGWNWLDSYQVLIVPYLTSAMGIFLFRQFYLTFPISLYESAKIDRIRQDAYCTDRYRYVGQRRLPVYYIDDRRRSTDYPSVHFHIHCRTEAADPRYVLRCRKRLRNRENKNKQHEKKEVSYEA